MPGPAMCCGVWGASGLLGGGEQGANTCLCTCLTKLGVQFIHLSESVTSQVKGHSEKADPCRWYQEALSFVSACFSKPGAEQGLPCPVTLGKATGHLRVQ